MKTFLAIVALALTGILSAQEITPQRGVSFNATGILPAHDHSSPRNGAISGAAKLAIVNVGDQNTAFTLDNTLDGTTRAPFIQFRKRTTAGTPAAVGAVLGQFTFDSSSSAGTSSEIRSTVRVIGSDAGGWPAGSDLDFRTAPGNAVTAPQTRLYIAEGGNIGIGTTNPATKLHMSSGTLTVDGAAAAIIIGVTNVTPAGIASGGIKISGVNDTGLAIVNPSGVDLEIRTVNSLAQIGTHSNHGVSLVQNGAVSMTLASGGLVGIGTASPANPLHVSGDTSGNVAWFESKLANSATVYIQAASGAGYIGTNGAATFALRTNTVDRVIVPNAAVTTGGALCLNASKVLSKCTNAPDASGNCTCP